MIYLKTISQIDKLRQSCKIVAYVLKELYDNIKPGITTKFLNDLAEDLCYQKGGTPGFKGYKGFPFSICASINEVVVHGFPNNVALKDNDLVSIDFGVLYKGWYGDSAFTKGVGKINKDVERLLKVGEECLYKGIEKAIPYNKVGDISHAVQKHAEINGYNVVRDFVGHGIGKNLHEAPNVPNYGNPNKGPLFEPGATIAIEPMVVQGSYKTTTLNDGWQVITQDKKLSVHFEHTVAILPEGTEILTNRN